MAAGSEKDLLAKKIREAIAAQGMTLVELANSSGLSLATVNRALLGRMTSKTRAQLERALPGFAQLPQAVDTDLGGYTSEQAARYRGRYILVRVGVERGAHIVAWPMEIRWETRAQALMMHSMIDDRKAAISMPSAALHFYIMWRWSGWPVLMAFERIKQDADEIMDGVVVTVNNYRGLAAIPAFLMRDDKLKREAQSEKVGVFEGKGNEPRYNKYRERLELVDMEKMVRMILPPWKTYGTTR